MPASNMGKLSYEQVMKVRQQMYDSHLQKGNFTPFIYPWDTLPPLYLVIALCVQPYLSRRSARFCNVFTFLLVTGHSAYVIICRRCLTMASGYAGGLVLTWITLITAVLLLVHDPQQDFARLEWRKLDIAKSDTEQLVGENQSPGQSSAVRRRKGQSISNGTIDSKPKLAANPTHKLVWQMLPSGFTHRIDWTLDLISSFRGPNWNYRIPTLTKVSAPPAPTKSIHLSSSLEISPSVVIEDAYDSSESSKFRFRAVRTTIILYLFVDLAKTVMISDIYFLGLAGLDAPCRWRIIPILHAYVGLPVGFLTRAVRLVVSLWGILNALTLIFSYSSTFVYTTIPLIVNPRKLSYSPLLDKRFFPTLLASPFPTIPDTGLGGFWGQCWHQMFRFSFTEPSRPILRYLGLSTKSSPGRAIQLLVAFGLSGILHMNGSYSCFSIVPSKPLMPLLFFLSQGLGVFLQTGVSELLFKTLKMQIPSVIRKTTNVLFVVTWLYYTGPLLADDFARCGIWLFEPIPVSLIRGLRGEGWWHWGGIKVQLWSGIEGKSTPMWDKGIGIF